MSHYSFEREESALVILKDQYVQRVLATYYSLNQTNLQLKRVRYKPTIKPIPQTKD